MTPFSIIIVIALYFLFLIAISYFTSKGADNSTFFLGNKKSPWYIVAFGMIGASLSGVTFISVPGWVGDSNFNYMQVVLGYFAGYLVVTNVLLPLYYKLNLVSIYTYLEQRFGNYSYKTGAWFFLLSRILGASFRLFIVADVLQITIFNKLGVPFFITVAITILLIWVYTNKGGIKTIIWTDTLQTLFMLLAVIFTVYFIGNSLNLNFTGIFNKVYESEYSSIFNFDNFLEKNHFLKQFIGGAFITIVMTGLDQDMMQKNLSCKNIKDAKKNMYWFSIILIPVNLLFLGLGALLFIYASNNGIVLPERSDELFPLIATNGGLPVIVSILFVLGIIAAAYSSADSALTSLTTSFSIDILEIDKKKDKNKQKRIRRQVHILFSIVLFTVILLFRAINNESVISSLLTVAMYSYGPLLGLYFTGIFTKIKTNDKMVPIIAVLSPILTILLNYFSKDILFGYQFGYELIIFNALFTVLGLFIFRIKK